MPMFLDDRNPIRILLCCHSKLIREKQCVSGVVEIRMIFAALLRKIMRIFFLKIFMKIFFLNLGCNYLSNAHARNTHDFQKKCSYKKSCEFFFLKIFMKIFFLNLGCNYLSNAHARNTHTLI